MHRSDQFLAVKFRVHIWEQNTETEKTRFLIRYGQSDQNIFIENKQAKIVFPSDVEETVVHDTTFATK